MALTATYVRQIDLENLTDPWGVAVDPVTADVLVANDQYGNVAIRRYDADGSFIENVAMPSGWNLSGVAVSADAATWWVTNYYGDSTYPRVGKLDPDGSVLASLFVGSFPTPAIEGCTDVAMRPDGKPYVVSDYYTGDGPTYKQKAVRLDTSGTLELTIGTNATLSGGEFPEPVVDGTFAYPVGVALDSAGNVYVSDVHKPYRTIQKFSSSGVHLLTFGGPGAGDGQFVNYAYAITGWHLDGQKMAFNENDRLFVTDKHGHKVNVYDTDGAWLLSFTTDDTPAGEMYQPIAVACGPNGAVYVTDYYGGMTQWLVTEGGGMGVRGVAIKVCGEGPC